MAVLVILLLVLWYCFWCSPVRERLPARAFILCLWRGGYVPPLNPLLLTLPLAYGRALVQG